MYLGLDDRQEIVAWLEDIDKLGKAWGEFRTTSKVTAHKVAELLPPNILRDLDELGDVLVCAEEPCIRVCKADYDFCEEHSHPS